MDEYLKSLSLSKNTMNKYLYDAEILIEYINANCRIVHEDFSSKSKRVEGLRLTDSKYRQLLDAAKDFVDERMLYITIN